MIIPKVEYEPVYFVGGSVETIYSEKSCKEFYTKPESLDIKCVLNYWKEVLSNWLPICMSLVIPHHLLTKLIPNGFLTHSLNELATKKITLFKVKIALEKGD